MNEPIYIILPVHNRAQLTACFVDCLLAQSDRDFHVLLVDDGCIDDTVKDATARLADVDVIRGDGNLWWAASVQKGIDRLEAREIGGDAIILIANDDTTFGGDFLARARTWLDAHPRSMLQAVPVDPATGAVIDRGIAIDWPSLGMRPAKLDEDIDCLATRCLFARLADVRTAGGFRPWLLPHYLSDYEFTIRAKRRGIALATSDDVQVNLSRETTGVRSTQALPLGRFLHVAFSKRHSFNPLYFSIFVLLAAPPWHVPLGLLRVWVGFCLSLLRSMRASLSGPRDGHEAGR